MVYWLGFIACTTAIVYSGSRLSRYGDVIAEKLKLSRALIGLILLAVSTSLPELITGIGSVTYAGAPDIAAGDVLGACVYNMFWFAMLDSLHRTVPITSQVRQGNLIAAGFGILLISLVGINIMAGERAPWLGWIGLSSLALIAVYLLAVRVIYNYEKKKVCELGEDDPEELRYNHITFRTALIAYGTNAAVVLVAAVLLPEIGKGIARDMGLGQTFVGNIFIGISTSLPELVVSFSAFRMGAVDLAAGNLFGSNIFNISILALDDFFYLKGPILAHVDSGHLVSALSGVAMTAVAVIGIAYRRERKRLFLSLDAIAISVIFILNLLYLYEVR